jgi:glutamyl-tRNA(Gln) amidotransferase subunit E
MKELNYEELGLKAGLEVHQQLNTNKLFIRTKSELNDNYNFEAKRKLRPVASELGEFDKAALDAFKRDETFIYKANTENISLIELDEEPPAPVDKDALRVVSEVALLLDANLVSEASVMRKTVIDGSNTSAFQRTMLISLGGKLKINKEKEVGVETIILEEDAARPISKENGKTTYNLDRLGIPLIELATAPDIRTPEEAVLTAKKIGEVMRLTCGTKRGKGTIRQDVNVSIKKGARCEIKGCQDLEQIKEVVLNEAQRQIDLVELKEELNKKFKFSEKLFSEIKEVTPAFKNTNCKFIKGNVFGIKINGFSGILGKSIGKRRFGSELSDYAKSSGVSGLLHKDELPNYGITNIEVDKINRILECEKEDNFVIIVANKEKCTNAFDAVKNRIKLAFSGVVEETRGAKEDGSSVYQRPLASGARMYPETDLFREVISEDFVKEIKKNLPKSVSEREKYYSKLGLSTNHINEMKLSNYARFFDSVVKKGANPQVASNLLLQTLKELKRENINLKKLREEEIVELLMLEKKGKINKNNLKNAIIEITKGKEIEEILKEQEKNKVDDKDVEKIISNIVRKNEKLVKERKMGSIGPLMGDIMKEEKLQNLDGKLISSILRKEIQKVI